MSDVRYPRLFVTSSSGTFSSTTEGSFVDVTNLSQSFTATGRPIRIECFPDTSTVASHFGYRTSFGASTRVYIQAAILRSGTTIALFDLTGAAGPSSTGDLYYPTSIVRTIDVPAAGSYTYKVQVAVVTSASAGTSTIYFTRALMAVYEL
jgi:hypothetical protein